VLEQAFREAENFKDEYVSTEHLLLGAAHSRATRRAMRWRRWARRTMRS
jgi:ATP-dependent Clp protease ATP-binding subunit ClpA